MRKHLPVIIAAVGVAAATLSEPRAAGHEPRATDCERRAASCEGGMSDPGTGDWPMWGGAPDRNMVSGMKGLTSWDLSAKRNVKWIADLGSTAYGNPVVAGGMVLVGTNNDAPRDPAVKGDKGILMAFGESDGEFMWQSVHDKLPAAGAHDWPLQGICSSPLVEDGVVYYTSNRGELMAVDLDGFRDGANDGLVKNETATKPTDADVIWRVDMMAAVGVRQHNMANGSPVGYGDLVFVNTSNGRDENDEKIPAPNAPSLVAVDKKTGTLAWQDNSAGDRILHGQWSSPAVGKVGDTVQVALGEGDGWVRGFDALTGRKLWEFDLNPKDAVWPKTRNEVISTPVFHEGVVYIASGQDPEHGEGVGHLYAIDATKRGDITDTGRLWHFDKIRRSMSTAAVYDGLVFAADFSGFLHALDARTGKPLWTHDMFAAVWGSPIVIDGKVYLGDEDGDVAVLAAARTLKVIAENTMGSAVYSTAVPAHGTLFILNRNQLVALAEQPGAGK